MKNSMKGLIAGLAFTLAAGLAVSNSSASYTSFAAAEDDTRTIAIEMAKCCIGSYAINFGTTKYNGVKYGVYREGVINGRFGLFPKIEQTDVNGNSLPGAFYNVDAIQDIRTIDIKYVGEGTLRYGTDYAREYSIDIPNHDSIGIETFTLEHDAAYFMVEAKTRMELTTINLNVGSRYVSTSLATQYTSDKRIPATVFEGNLVDGVSSVNVPTKIEIEGNDYTVLETKKYTYYSFDYVEKNRSTLNLDDIALIEPVDVANYYIAFHALPVNYYGYTNETSDDYETISEMGASYKVTTYFGKKARAVSQYDRESGYARAVPYSGHQNYLELDFDDGFYSNGRGSGRVVIWTNGWTNSNGDAVAVYTDDHYYCFSEYLNYGIWGTTFGAEDSSHRTMYKYGKSSTLNDITPEPPIPSGGEDPIPSGGEDPTPTPTPNNGCGGSIIGASSIIFIVSAMGLSFTLFKRKEKGSVK